MAIRLFVGLLRYIFQFEPGFHKLVTKTHRYILPLTSLTPLSCCSIWCQEIGSKWKIEHALITFSSLP